MQRIDAKMYLSSGVRQVGEIVVLDLAPWRGHSQTYTSAVVRELKTSGHSVTLLAEEAFRTEADTHTVVDGRRMRLHGPHLEHGRVIDLDYARTLRLELRGWRHPRLSVLVLHGVGLVRVTSPEEIGRMRSRVRARIFVELMRRDVRRGSCIVVHTSEAKDFLDSEGVASTLVRLSSMFTPGGPTPQPVQRDLVLFVGGVRKEKGFSEGLAAVRAVPWLRDRRVVVSGAGDFTGAASKDPCVEYEGRLSAAELLDRYARASLVVLPYPPQYALTGAASLVLQEALSMGCKVVATPWARSQSSSENLFVAGGYGQEDIAAAVAVADRSSWQSDQKLLRLDDYVRALVDLTPRARDLNTSAR